MTDTFKATIAIKAETLRDLTDALQSIGESANVSFVLNATISTSIAIEADEADDLRLALDGIAEALEDAEGVQATVKAPANVYARRRLDATPMERMIRRATGD